jgi:chromosome segregation ATPase
MRTRIAVAALIALLLPAATRAQSDVEEKLRDVLRQTVVQLRALQDQQAQLQADRDSAVQQRNQLQQQLADLQAKQAPPAPTAAKPDTKALDALRQQLAAEQARNAALAASNAKWQAAYRQAAQLAQTRDADAKRLAAGLQAARQEDAIDHVTNQKLASLAGDILHLYKQNDFRNLLLESYEPLLGFKEVQLENLVQGYEDRIYDLRIFAQKAASP